MSRSGSCAVTGIAGGARWGASSCHSWLSPAPRSGVSPTWLSALHAVRNHGKSPGHHFTKTEEPQNHLGPTLFRKEKCAITGIDTVWMAGALALTVLASLHLALSGDCNCLSRTFRMRGSGVSRLASLTPFACVSTTF